MARGAFPVEGACRLTTRIMACRAWIVRSFAVRLADTGGRANEGQRADMQCPHSPKSSVGTERTRSWAGLDRERVTQRRSRSPRLVVGF